MNLYEKTLIDHYHNPKNYGTLNNPHFVVQEYNPSCGDLISLEGHIHNTLIEELRFTAQGCIISKATASLLTLECTGKSIAYSASLTSDDILKLIGITLGPLRLKCALSPYKLYKTACSSTNLKNIKKNSYARSPKGNERTSRKR